MTEIKYNGSVVATIPNGNKATIPVKDLTMKSDIEITVKGGGDTGTALEAFMDGGLTEVVLPTATKIRDYAFYKDSTIRNVEMPNVTSIGNAAFKGCVNLALTRLPSGVTIIADNTFSGCTNLALTSLPSGITSIGSWAFIGCAINLTELPSGVTSIGNAAFKGCVNLALTRLPSGVTIIDDKTFSGCTNLALTSLPSGITRIHEDAFRDCTNLTLTELPSGLTSIGRYAFSGCTGLTSLTFKSKPTSIHSYAFNGCTNLMDIYVPWEEGAVSGAPWRATNATIHYMSFTINGTSYRMGNRMTWYDWTRSEYNIDGFVCASENDYVYEAESENKVTDAEGNDVLGTTYIVEGGAYLIKEATNPKSSLIGVWRPNTSVSTFDFDEHRLLVYSDVQSHTQIGSLKYYSVGNENENTTSIFASAVASNIDGSRFIGFQAQPDNTLRICNFSSSTTSFAFDRIISIEIDDNILNSDIIVAPEFYEVMNTYFVKDEAVADDETASASTDTATTIAEGASS